MSLYFRGGYSNNDVYYSFGEIRLGYIHTVVPTFFVWPICDPHVEPPDDDPPSPDWLTSDEPDEN